MNQSGSTSGSTGPEREFASVDLLAASPGIETAGVDAFVLSVIKVERQVRRLITFSVFQFSCFDTSSVPALTQALAVRRIYLRGLTGGFDLLHQRTVADLVGPEAGRLMKVIDRAKDYRNKIFHGQLTGAGLGTTELLGIASDLKTWCRLLGAGAEKYMNYQGFGDSFRKAPAGASAPNYRRQIGSIADYEKLLDEMVAMR